MANKPGAADRNYEAEKAANFSHHPSSQPARRIEACLGSLCCRPRTPAFEVIVVDNGSNRFPGRRRAISGTLLLQELNLTWPARNRGAEAASAEILHSPIRLPRIQTGNHISVRPARAAADNSGGDVQIWREPNTAITALEGMRVCLRTVSSFTSSNMAAGPEI
jgi:hypothetical protein